MRTERELRIEQIQEEKREILVQQAHRFGHSEPVLLNIQVMRDSGYRSNPEVVTLLQHNLEVLRAEESQLQAEEVQVGLAEQAQTLQDLRRQLHEQMPWLRGVFTPPQATQQEENILGATTAVDIQALYRASLFPQEPLFIIAIMPDGINIPAHLCCPITGYGQLMYDPVTTRTSAPDPQTYERENIEKWLADQNNHRDPNTNLALLDRTLTNNLTARQAIEDFLNNHPNLKHTDAIYLPRSFLAKLTMAIMEHRLADVRDLIQQEKRLLSRMLVPERTAFHAACEIGTKEILFFILEQLTTAQLKIILALPKPQHWQPAVLNQMLFAAVDAGNVDEIANALRYGADIEARDATWKTPLCRAAHTKQLQAAKTLLEEGANISARDQQNNAALDYAVLNAHSVMVRTLLNFGVPVYNPTSASDQRYFSYLALKFVHEEIQAMEEMLRAAAKNAAPQQPSQAHSPQRSPVTPLRTQSMFAENVQQTVLKQIPLGLTYQSVLGNGSCFFCAVGLYLGQDVGSLRNSVATHIENNIQDFLPFFRGTEAELRDQIIRTRDGNEMADHFEIEAVQRITNRPVIIIRPNANPTIPDLQRYTGEPIFVYYDNHVHYDALILQPGANARKILTTLQAQLAQQNSSSRQSSEHSVFSAVS